MAKDIFHETVRKALETDGWSITHDPLPIRILGIEGDIDLGAEKVIAAEKLTDGQKVKIAVEIKSFLSLSFMRDFHTAVGQYTNYKILLEVTEADRHLYLAIPQSVFERKFSASGVQLVLKKAGISLLVFDETNKTITTWEK